jgi:DHA1 family quinolone resistance protein-like MFS transporter
MSRIGWRNLFSINKILKVLVLSDVIIFSGWGLMSPIFAVFVNEQIAGATLVTVGIAEAIYLATKSILQIPIGVWIDETEGEKIDFWLAFWGSLLTAVAILLYTLAKTPLHIYFIELLFGISGAMAYPAWMGLFSRNIERGRESFIWGLHSTTTELAWAGTAVIGGYVAEKYGFGSLFLTAGAVALVGSFVLFVVYKEVAPK